MRGRGIALVLGIATLAAGCPAGGESADAEQAVETMTRQQKDSVIAESRLPGARGVRGALDASDAAARRAAEHDSIR
jgi:hypothetical protein